MNSPHILYLHSHDTGRYIQPYGYAVPTPNLQRLAEQGVLFRQCFCAAPTCSPSRAALLTGQAAHSAGMIGLAHRGFALADYGQHLIHILHAAGYRSALCGIQHVAAKAETIGYQEIIPSSSRHAEDVAPAAAAWLRRRGHEGSTSPFFLSVGFFETHREYPAPGPTEDPRYCLPPAPLPDTPETRRDMAAYKASARLLDTGIGQVLKALEESGLAEDTLVICTTDHGPAFPAMKCNLTDHGIGVMLIMRGPGGFTGGRVLDAMVSQIDIFPTICELAAIAPPPWLQGKSWLPLLRGERAEIHDDIFAEVTYHAAYEPMRCVRTRRYKYIRRFDDRDAPVLPNCDDSPSKALWMDHGWAERAPAAEQLYDLIFDPNETNNLAADPALTGVLADMRGRLQRWMERTDDPLLKTRAVPAPSGAEINDPDGLSPREPTHTAP
ncbi:MAG: sulfatase [Chloroflexi bacterium]|nr:sulfatase [Chloroflexota bacterium]